MKKTLSQWQINSLFFLGNTFFLVLFYHHIFQTYAFSDDYSILHNVLYKPSQYEHFQRAGRPILGWLFLSTWSHFTTIDSLIYARIGGLLTCSLFFTVIFHDLRKLTLSLKTTLAIILAIETSPAYAVIFTWSTMFFFSLTATIAYLAGSYHLKNPFSLMGNAACLLALFICAATYQPTLTCFFIPLLFQFFFSHTNSLPKVKPLFVFFLTFTLANIAYLTLFKLNIWPFDIAQNSRANMDFSPDKKWQWLSKTYGDYLLPLHGAISAPHDLLFYQYLMGSFILGGMILLFKRYYQHKPLLIPLLLAFPLLVIYPNLATTDNYIAFRTLISATFLMVCLVAYTIQHLPLCALRKGISLLLLTLGALLTYQNYAQLIITPTIKEYKIVEQQVKHIVEEGHTELIFIRPPIQASTSFLVKSEYGFNSTHHRWIPIRMINLITTKHYQNPTLLTTHQFASDVDIPISLINRNIPIIKVVK